MLGSVESAHQWHWTAHGKHPVAGDYFSVGQELPVLQAFADWVEKGYRALHAKRLPSAGLCSWRFWGKGARKGTLICGLVRDSTDRVGRSYPFLVVGSGPLNEWEGQWDLVPFACERSWNQMERLSTRTLKDFKEFNQEVRRMRAPTAQWSDFLRERGELDTPDLIVTGEVSDQKTAGLFDQQRISLRLDDIFLPLSVQTFDDQLKEISAWHSLIKTQSRKTPKTVFMGGSPEAAYLAVFQRPLTAADFVRLWSENTTKEPSWEIHPRPHY